MSTLPTLPWPEETYRVDLTGPPSSDLAEAAATVFRRVWRTTLAEPGFALVRFPGPVESRDLRRVLFRLVDAMPFRFVPERLGRFDQQVSSRFHRDGAPPASLLLLGYEPTAVPSRVFLADAHRAALDAGLGIRDYLAAHNPMTPAGETRLWPHATELAVPAGEAHLLVINNSLLPLDAGGPLGMLHRAQIVSQDPTARRVINSAGFQVAGDPAATPLSPAAVEHFLARVDLD